MTLVKFANGKKDNALNPLFSDVFESLFNDTIGDRMISRVPAVNIAETDSSYYIELAAPGLKKDDFKINLDRNVLSVSSEKKDENTAEGKRYTKREYSFSTFVRSFTLPESADQTQIEAGYVDGVLKINVAKKEEAKYQSREISIK